MAEIKLRQGTVNGEPGLVSDERVYETKDGRLVGADDPEATALVAAAGQIIDAATARRLRLSEKGQAPPGEAPPAETVTPVPTPPPAAPAEPPQEPAPAPSEAPKSGTKPAK